MLGCSTCCFALAKVHEIHMVGGPGAWPGLRFCFRQFDFYCPAIVRTFRLCRVVSISGAKVAPNFSLLYRASSRVD